MLDFGSAAVGKYDDLTSGVRLEAHATHAQEMAFGPQPGFPTEGASRMFSEWARQLQKETDTLQDAIREYEGHVTGASKRKDFTAQGPTRRVLQQWYPILVDAIRKEQQAVSLNVSKLHKFFLDHHWYSPHVRGAVTNALLDPAQLHCS